jgi:GNAT superfamily N-acetyltransferase
MLAGGARGVRLRTAWPADAAALGAMHAASWAETYPGLVPDDLLAEMSDPARRGEAWARILAAPALPSGILLAEDAEGIAGFASAGPARDPALGASGEVTGLYVLRRAQRRGLATVLLGAALRALRAAGHADAGAWALDGNAPAARFYAASGAVAGATREEARGPHRLRETAWLWTALSARP